MSVLYLVFVTAEITPIISCQQTKRQTQITDFGKIVDIHVPVEFARQNPTFFDLPHTNEWIIFFI